MKGITEKLVVQPMFKKHKLFYRDSSSCQCQQEKLNLLTICIASSHFGREVNSNKYHYCTIFVQSLSAYSTTNR